MIFLFQIMFIIPFVPICCQSILPHFFVIIHLLFPSSQFSVLLHQHPGQIDLLRHAALLLHNVQMASVLMKLHPAARAMGLHLPNLLQNQIPQRAAVVPAFRTAFYLHQTEMLLQNKRRLALPAFSDHSRRPALGLLPSSRKMQRQ